MPPTSTGRLAETGNLWVRRKSIELSTIRNNPASAQRSHCWETTNEEEIRVRGLVSLPRICSNNAALACCSSDTCNLRETAFGRLAEPIDEIGSTPCNPASGPCISAG